MMMLQMLFHKCVDHVQPSKLKRPLTTIINTFLFSD